MRISRSLVSANGSLVSVNRVLTEKKLHWNQLRNKQSLTELNRGLQSRSLETETLTEFNRVKTRFSKLTEEKSEVNRVKPRIINSNS